MKKLTDYFENHSKGLFLGDDEKTIAEHSAQRRAAQQVMYDLYGEDWIMKHIGMDADELLRLKQISGLAELFKNKEFSTSWE